MQGLNETWEEKMQRTQEVQKEREKALEELGISVEKNNVGVHTPKKVRRVLLSFACSNWCTFDRCPTWSTWYAIHCTLMLVCDIDHSCFYRTKVRWTFLNNVLRLIKASRPSHERMPDLSAEERPNSGLSHLANA